MVLHPGPLLLDSACVIDKPSSVEEGPTTWSFEAQRSFRCNMGRSR